MHNFDTGDELTILFEVVYRCTLLLRPLIEHIFVNQAMLLYTPPLVIFAPV